MKRGAAPPKKWLEFETFLPLFKTLLGELDEGRLSKKTLPPVVTPEVLQYAKQGDNVVECALLSLSKFKKPSTADLAGLIADENHAQLAGVMDGQALLSVLVAHYLCKYDEVFSTARKHFSKLSDEICLRIMSDTDTFAMPREDPTALHLALLQCLKEDTADAMGQLAVAVHQSSNAFDNNKGKILETAHAFVRDVADLSSRSAGETKEGAEAKTTPKPPKESDDAVPGARREEVEAEMLSDLPPLPSRTSRFAAKPARPAPPPPPPPTTSEALIPPASAPARPQEAPQAPQPAPLPAAQSNGHAARQVVVERAEDAPVDMETLPAEQQRLAACPRSPPWSPAQHPLDLSPPRAPPRNLSSAGQNNRLRFYGEATIGLNADSDLEDDAVTLKLTSSRRKQREQPPPPPTVSFRGDVMDVDGGSDEDDLAFLKAPSGLATFKPPPPAPAERAPDSEDDMPDWKAAPGLFGK